MKEFRSFLIDITAMLSCLVGIFGVGFFGLAQYGIATAISFVLVVAGTLGVIYRIRN